MATGATTATAIARHDGGARIQQAGEERLARMESVRALAALAVLVAHVWGVHHSYGPGAIATVGDRLVFGTGYGVYLFFALSGYLLFRPFARSAFGGGEHVDLLAYARNRALRILPLYYAVIALLFVLEGHGGTTGELVRFATFTQNFFSDTVLHLDGPAWSLIVEVQFYVLLPLVAWLLARLSRGSLRAAAGLVLAGAVVGLGVRLWLLEYRDIADKRIVFSLAATSFFFAPGLLLALARTASDRGLLRMPRGVLGSADTWALAAVAVLVPAGAASLVLAFVSYQAIESPFLRMRRRWSRRDAAEPARAPAGDGALVAAAARP